MDNDSGIACKFDNTAANPNCPLGYEKALIAFDRKQNQRIPEMP